MIVHVYDTKYAIFGGGGGGGGGGGVCVGGGGGDEESCISVISPCSPVEWSPFPQL